MATQDIKFANDLKKTMKHGRNVVFLFQKSAGQAHRQALDKGFMSQLVAVWGRQEKVFT